jgi:hypothetical protein
MKPGILVVALFVDLAAAATPSRPRAAERPDTHAAYLREAEEVRLQFNAVTGRVVDDIRFTPAVTG